MPDNWWNIPANKNVLLKRGYVVNADSIERGDVKIENGTIMEVGKIIRPTDDFLTLDVAGMFIMPGGIDPNTHLDYTYKNIKTVDDFYYGTRAAVAGGTTMIMDFVMPQIGESMEDAYRKWRRRADTEVVCDYALHMGITWWDDDVEKEMSQVAISCGINGFLINMAFKRQFMLNDAEIYQACMRCKEIGALPMFHAENGTIIDENVRQLLNKGIRGVEGHYLSRPQDVEEEATLRACTIAKQVQSPLYFCNVMSKPAADIIIRKRREGVTVFGETIPAALGGVGQKIEGHNFRIAAAHVTCPPISDDESTPTELMQMLANEELNTTGSNNCTYDSDQKARGKHNFSRIPYGVNGVEDRMSVIWEKGVNSGILTPSQFVAITSTNAAKLFNVFPKKGAIKPGSDADIVVWNPKRMKVISHHNHRQAVDYNIFTGMYIHGGPEYVFVKGNLCVENDVLRFKKGYGNYIHTQCFSQMAYPRKLEGDKTNDFDDDF